MEAGVDPQSTGSPRVEGEHAEAGEIVRVETHLVGKPLGVEAPTLHVGGDYGVLLELGHSFELLSDRNLEVMTRDALVEGEGFGLVTGSGLRLRGVCGERVGAWGPDPWLPGPSGRSRLASGIEAMGRYGAGRRFSPGPTRPAPSRPVPGTRRTTLR